MIRHPGKTIARTSIKRRTSCIRHKARHEKTRGYPYVKKMGTNLYPASVNPIERQSRTVR